MIKRLKLLSTQFISKVNRTLSLPGQCIACCASFQGRGLCSRCLDALPYNWQRCRQCALPLAFAPAKLVLCGECLKHPPAFDRVITPLRYQFPVNRLISRYKYSHQRALGRPLINVLAHEVSGHLIRSPTLRPDILVPSPMHPAKQRKRGFNQAEDIAEHLSLSIGVPWSVTLVKRQRAGPAQSGLNRQQRLANLREAFEVTGRPPPRIAIIDDVVTTGATARVLAELLKTAGALEVEVWALARTPG
ncbi:MAG: ComF family protein [Marinobacter sp.]|uniref:ComF family protein n=1 Tax=Marinobacter sp. TaxID=50741 RepID=UPI0034A05EAF